MKHFGIKAVIIVNYFLFAMLLNSVGILIQKSMNVYGVEEVTASTLELFKDMSIALVSFMVGSLLPRIGYKSGFLAGLILVFAGCIAMYFGNSFGYVQLLFACVGISFALVKVAVYALIGNMSESPEELSSFLSTVESVFMVGIALTYVFFPVFYSDTDPRAWLRIYLAIAGLILFCIAVVSFTDFGNIAPKVVTNPVRDIRDMLYSLKTPMVLVFALSAFLYVMTEQGIMSWLPTFNERVLHLPERISINLAMILALSIAAGRILASYLVKRVKWVTISLVCLAAAALTVLFMLPMAGNLKPGVINSLADVPILAYVFPLIGLFLAPVYPLMNSSVLGATDKAHHSSMAGVLTFFSAVGGTLGSRVVGYLFREIGGDKAFYFSVIPISILLVTLWFLHRQTSRKPAPL